MKLVTSLEYFLIFPFQNFEFKEFELLEHLCTYQYFPSEGGGGGEGRGIRQQKNPNPGIRTPRQGGRKLDAFSGSSKLNYITNLMVLKGILDKTYLSMGVESDPNF